MDTPPPGQTTRIAIADDSAVIRNLIEEILRYIEGYKLVASFDNGPDIVAWVREGGEADVYVIDMRLPGLSGTATISALRRFTATARILAFSASAQEESVRSATSAGANGYLLKESTLAELLAAISGGEGVHAAENTAEAPQQSAPEQDEAPGRGVRVLVIDDHDLVRDAAAAMLESKGFSVDTCSSATGARDWLEAGNHCDAALVDLRLGDGSGASIVEVFRARVPAAAVILHSGAADEDGERVARETSADGFLAKGDYTIDEMVDTLMGAVTLRRRAT
jgi:DNA-binding NarL/FixJ family response regulator